MRNLNRIMSQQFTRFKPTLCPGCAFYESHPEWFGVCNATGRLLSNPKSEKRNKCSDHKAK